MGGSSARRKCATIENLGNFLELPSDGSLITYAVSLKKYLTLLYYIPKK